MKHLLQLSIVALFMSQPMMAQWGSDVGSESQLTDSEGLKINTLIEPGPDDGWYVSYTILDGNTYTVHLIRTDSTGAVLWDNVIHDLSAVGNTDAKMIGDMNDGIILAWTDRRDPDHPTIYANRIDMDGVKLWGADDVAVSITEGAHSCPKMISNGSGGAIVAYEDTESSLSMPSGILANGIDGNGSGIYETFLFPNDGDCDNFSITTDGNGGVAAFTAYANVVEGENQIRGMRLNESGAKQWTDENISIGPISIPIGQRFQGSSDGYFEPVAAYHPDAGIYLLYYMNMSGDFMYNAELISLDGSELWDSEGVIVSSDQVTTSETDVLTDLNGDFYFSILEDGNWNLQKVLADGSLPWTLSGVEYSSDGTGNPDNLDLTTCNDVMIAVDGIDDIIHAVRIDEDGNAVYDPPLLPLSADQLDDQHRDPYIRVNDNDRVIVVWADDEDINDGQWDLKAQGFHKDGTLGNLTSTNDLNIPGFKLYPNPAGSRSGHLTIEAAELGLADVYLLDLSGRQLMGLANVDFSTNATRIDLPANLDTGIYFIQIRKGGKQLTTKVIID